jgi:hypothetical protein
VSSPSDRPSILLGDCLLPIPKGGGTRDEFGDIGTGREGSDGLPAESGDG